MVGDPDRAERSADEVGRPQADAGRLAEHLPVAMREAASEHVVDPLVELGYPVGEIGWRDSR